MIGTPASLSAARRHTAHPAPPSSPQAVVERCGKFHKVADEGFHFLWPFIDQIRPLHWRLTTCANGLTNEIFELNLDRIDLRESCYEFPNSEMITRDNVTITVRPMMLYRIIDPVRAVYEVYDVAHALNRLVQTTLRALVGDMGLDDVLVSRVELNRSLLAKVGRVFAHPPPLVLLPIISLSLGSFSPACRPPLASSYHLIAFSPPPLPQIGAVVYNWGIEVTAVELLDISPKREIQDAMHRQIAAECLRRSQVVLATGVRDQLKLEAEGECKAAITNATAQQRTKEIEAHGEAESRKIIALAEAQALAILDDVLRPLGVAPADYMLGIR